MYKTAIHFSDSGQPLEYYLSFGKIIIIIFLEWSNKVDKE